MEEKREKGEDATKYGEFISSFFEWETPKDQRKIVNRLENITNNQKSEKKEEKKRK